MKRIDAYGATADLQFTNGSPVDGIPPTRVSADWLNVIQEEVSNVVEAAGLTLDQTGQNKTQLLQAVRSLVQGAPIGSVVMWAGDGSSCPEGWMFCHGDYLSTEAFPLLFAAIGYTFGGEGNVFQIPDLRGMFVRGTDENRGIDPGRQVASYQDDQLKAHSHSVTIRLADNNDDEVAPPAGSDGRLKSPQYTLTSGSTGGSETRPKNVAMHYIIHAGPEMA